MTHLIRLLRPRQWTKNLVVFAGVAFAQRATNSSDLLKALGALGVFCILSGVVYVVNDIADREADRRHPAKRHRPIASGDVSVRTAAILATVLAVIALSAAVALSVPFATVAGAYLALMLAYSRWLKHTVILDVFSISAGFVLRAVAGAAVIGVEISSWLIVCTILLSLFLGMSKRRHELLMLETGAANHRPILAEYSPELLDQMISVVTSSTVIAYALYTLSPETVAKFHTHALSLTIPFVLYGIFRYLYLVHKRDLGGSPERVLLEDKPLLVAVAAWAVCVAVAIYYVGPHRLL
ncbi:MAG: decaprenyl-phosphate phosphoribosyltransferase [Candidatus Eisenbacteria bacterium]|jgi:4-hydroxybenzoate polyprenyltransferase|nr:decaprenyl-phosphate phosphoribosyltransferase [Candidatus Eisenbacteria bacterium]